MICKFFCENDNRLLLVGTFLKFCLFSPSICFYKDVHGVFFVKFACIEEITYFCKLIGREMPAPWLHELVTQS